ncbi:hypothetical protein [Sphingomonas sp.]|uniref:hypothetical protein n=1 Tax=Sphingomonas sp. TaxID=28214 RepID=UPI0025F1B605|nr:hypothetical protein [Sphingomonas sp.]
MSNWILPVVGLAMLVLVTVQALSAFGSYPRIAAETDDDLKGDKLGFDQDYTAEAEALFKRFAERHGLHYEVEDAPMEACWTFPQQPKLSMPVTLGLQNGDELNFGVSDFWSYFFPFENVAERFEHAIDAWVTGDARIAVTGRHSRLLQVREGNRWRSIYGANGCLFPFRWTPLRYEMNEPGRLPTGSA